MLGAAFAAGRYRDVASHSSFESAGRELNSPSLTQQARNTWLWVDGRSQRQATNSQNLRTPRKFWHRSVFSFQCSVFSFQFSVARLWRQRFLECGDLSPLSFSDEMSLNGNGSFSDRGDVKKKAPTGRSTKSLEICVIV